MKTHFKYESGKPIPSGSANDKGYTKAVRELPRGMSVLLPISAQHARAIVQYLTAGGERKAGEYITRKDGDGARIWRK